MEFAGEGGVIGDGAEGGEGGIVGETAAVFESRCESLAKIVEGAILAVHLGEKLGETVVLAGAILIGDGAADDLGGIEIEDGGVHGKGAAIGRDPGTGFALSEVGCAEIGGSDGGIG